MFELVVSGVFEENLIEILLTVILLFNVGAYGLLRNDITAIEDKITGIEGDVGRLWNRIFGIEADKTNGGHLMETDERFDKLDNKLEEICKKIDEESTLREKEFEYLEQKVKQMIVLLSEEENIEIKRSDFEDEDRNI